MKGKKTGGRKAGVPNRRTVERRLHRRAAIERHQRLHDDLVAAIEAGELPADNEALLHIKALLHEHAHPDGPHVPRPLERSATPLDTMLESMWLALDKWRYPPPGQSAAETLAAARLAVEAAERAAPYVHPRLAAVAAQIGSNDSSEPLSMFELAKRLAYVLQTGAAELRAQEGAVLPALPAPPPHPVYTEVDRRLHGDPRFQNAEKSAEDATAECVAQSKQQQELASRSENCRPDNFVPSRQYREPPPRVIIGARGRG